MSTPRIGARKSTPRKAAAGKVAAPLSACAPADDPLLTIEYCREHRDYFRANALKIATKARGLQPFVANTTQRVMYNMIDHMRRQGVPPRLIVLKSRQVGISTASEAEIFSEVLFNEHRSGLVLAHNKAAAKGLLRMTQRFYRNLPKNLRIGANLANVHELELTNGSRMQVEAVGDVRSYTAQYVHISEFAFMENAAEMFLALMQSVPNDENSLAIIESTANGVGNKFHQMWLNAIAGSEDPNAPPWDRGWTPVFIPWFKHEEYQMTPWFGQMDVTTEERKLAKAHSLTMRHLAWRRWCIKTNCDGDVAMFQVEYPSCVVAGTRVGTARGIIPVEQVKVGDAATCGEVQHLHKQRPSKVYKLTTDLGYELCGTGHHPVFTEGGVLVRLSDLEPGIRVKLQAPRLADSQHQEVWRSAGVDHSIEITPEWGEFLGLFMADGSFGGDTLSIACDRRDSDIVERAKSLIESLFGLKAGTRVVGNNGGGIEVRVGSRDLRDTFLRLGLLRQRSDTHYLRRVCVPECIWRSPESVVRRFLSGLFEGDGFTSKTTTSTTLFTKYPDFARDVQLLLLSVGITSRRRSGVDKRAGDGHHYQSNNVVLRATEARKFRREIGFLSERKRSCQGEESPQGRKPSPIVMADEVAAVVESGVEATYDLTVKDGHAFDAGGILTHNTWQEAFALSGRPVFDTEGLAHYEAMVPAMAGLTVNSPIEGGTQYVYHDAKPLEIGWDPGERKATFDEVEQGRLRIFKPFNPRHTYIIGADPSEGDTKSDPSPLEVLDQMTLEFVAEWWGRTPPDMLADYAAWLGTYYGNALIIGEANNHGISFHGRLIALEYANLYFRSTTEESIAGEVTLKPGYWETNKAKHLLIDTYRKYVREKRGGIFSPGLVGEMRTTIYERREGFTATKIKPQPGNFIDRVMAAGMALFAHRGDIESPLLPLPEIELYRADQQIRQMRDRDPEGAARLALDLTGMSEGELSAVLDAKEQDRRRNEMYGIGGLR